MVKLGGPGGDWLTEPIFLARNSKNYSIVVVFRLFLFEWEFLNLQRQQNSLKY